VHDIDHRAKTPLMTIHAQIETGAVTLATGGAPLGIHLDAEIHDLATADVTAALNAQLQIADLDCIPEGGDVRQGGTGNRRDSHHGQCRGGQNNCPSIVVHDGVPRSRFVGVCVRRVQRE
jgi:hypothetical protein